MSRQAEILEQMLGRLLIDQRFFKLVVVEEKKWTQSSIKKLLRGVVDKQWKDNQPGMVNLTFKTSILALTCAKIEGLDVTLDY